VVVGVAYVNSCVISFTHINNYILIAQNKKDESLGTH